MHTGLRSHSQSIHSLPLIFSTDVEDIVNKAVALGVGVIVAIVIGSLIVVVLIIVLCVCCCYHCCCKSRPPAQHHTVVVTSQGQQPQPAMVMQQPLNKV